MTTSQQHLDKAVNAWKRGVLSRRDQLLETGWHLHEYLVAGHKERDALPLAKRAKAKNLTRKSMNKRAIERLGVCRTGYDKMLYGRAVVDLLSDNGNIGTMSFDQLIQFACLLRRNTGVGNSTFPGRDFPCEDMEDWSIKPGCEEAVELFRRAVREKLDWKTTWQLTKRLNPNPAPTRHATVEDRFPNQTEKRRKDLDDRENGESLKIDIPKAIKVAAPKEAAEMLYKELMSNHDPVAVAHHLLGMLDIKKLQAEVNRRQRKTA